MSNPIPLLDGPFGPNGPSVGIINDLKTEVERMRNQQDTMGELMDRMQNDFQTALDQRDRQNAILAGQIQQLEEAKGLGIGENKTPWVTLKMLTPEQLKNVTTWKSWKARAMAYFNTATPGMEEALCKVSKQSDVTMDWLTLNVKFAHRTTELYQALVTFTSDEAKRIVEAENGNGFQAWKALVQFYEPATKTLDINVWSEFLKERSREKSPAETKKKLLDIEEGISKIKAALSDAPQEKLLIGMMHSVMDHATFNALGRQLLCESMTYAETRDLVVSMCNATASMHKAEIAYVCEEEESEYIEAVETRTCFHCGKTGHLQ